MKSNYLEISKVYDFVGEISEQNLKMSNITYYKNITYKTIDFVINKFEEYFKLEKQSRQTYKDRKNIEGYKLKILVSEVLLERDNRSKLRAYIEKSIELITSYQNIDRLKYVVSFHKTRGGSCYLNIYFIDRVIYPKPLTKTTTKEIWVNKNTGKKVSKTYANAIQEKVTVEEKLYFSNKLRFKLIHQNSRETFIEMIEAIKTILKQYELKVFQTDNFYLFEKKHIKKRIKKNGNYYFVNDNDNVYKGVLNDYQARAVKIYNMLVNSLYMSTVDLKTLDLNKLRTDIESLEVKYKTNIDKYEKSILNFIKMIKNEEMKTFYFKS